MPAAGRPVVRRGTNASAGETLSLRGHGLLHPRSYATRSPRATGHNSRRPPRFAVGDPGAGERRGPLLRLVRRHRHRLQSHRLPHRYLHSKPRASAPVREEAGNGQRAPLGESGPQQRRTLARERWSEKGKPGTVTFPQKARKGSGPRFRDSVYSPDFRLLLLNTISPGSMPRARHHSK